jgi:hypothetical protein
MVSLKFFIDSTFQLLCGPGVDSATNRNEYQQYFLGDKGGRCIGLLTLPPSCADFVEIWELESAGSRLKPGTLNLLDPTGPVQTCAGICIMHK